MRRNCATGLPNLARLALYLFVCGRGGLNKFAAKLLGTLRKSSELENGELSIDDSAPERFCKEFRSGANSSCVPHLNWGAAKLESGKRDRKLAPKQLCKDLGLVLMVGVLQA